MPDTPPPKNLSAANYQRGNPHWVLTEETKAAEVESIVRNAAGPSALNHSPRDVPCHRRQRRTNKKICNFYPKRNDQQFPSLSGRSSPGESLKAMFPNELIVKIETLRNIASLRQPLSILF